MQNIKGRVLFDAECRFCTRLAKRVAPLLHRHGFSPAPLQTTRVVNIPGRGSANAWSEMLLLRPDGATYGGADALIELTHKIWWARPLYWLSYVPGVRRGLRKAYAWVARRRLCLGGACQVQDAPNSAGRSLLKWLPALGLAALAMALGQRLPGWGLMWVTAVACSMLAAWKGGKP